MGGNGRERAVSFPKIILRPHFKKENLRLFGDGLGEKIRQVRESEKWRQLIRTWGGGSRAEAAGEGPAEGTGGPSAPCMGRARTEPMLGADTGGVRKPSLILRGVYTVFCLQGEK